MRKQTKSKHKAFNPRIATNILYSISSLGDQAGTPDRLDAIPLRLLASQSIVTVTADHLAVSVFFFTVSVPSSLPTKNAASHSET